MNTLTTWASLRASVEWICLYHLYAGLDVDVYGIHDILQDAKHLESPIELFVREGECTPWLTSTWTLQEFCLCPEMVLCTKDWEPFEIGNGSQVTLHQLLTIETTVHASDRPEIADWPKPVLQLADIHSMVNGQSGDITRLSILSAGVTRECEHRRADAVMSAIGMTEWYDAYFQQNQRPPPEKDLVLGSYPLAFVREVATKMGAEFFSDFNPDDMKPGARGTLLPFKEPGSVSTGSSSVAPFGRDIGE